jgi:hypothetical protein
VNGMLTWPRDIFWGKIRSVGRPVPGQVVGWGHARANASGSGNCWEPWCASARAFVPMRNQSKKIQRVRDHISGVPRSIGVILGVLDFPKWCIITCYNWF